MLMSYDMAASERAELYASDHKLSAGHGFWIMALQEYKGSVFQDEIVVVLTL